MNSHHCHTCQHLRRRTLTLAALAWPLALTSGFSAAGGARAQGAVAKVWRIVFLSPTLLERDKPRADTVAAFHVGMRERGLQQGRDYQFEVLSVDGDNARYPALVAQALAAGADLFVVPGNTGAMAAKRGAGKVPVVFVGVGNPAEIGLVETLARPGGHVTGRTSITQELDAKRLELLRELIPGMNRLAVLATRTQGSPASEGATTRGHARGVQLLDAAAQKLGVALQVFAPSVAAEIEGEVVRAIASKPQAVIVFDQSMLFPLRRQWIEHFNRAHIPTMYQSRGWVEQGGLMAYGAANLDEYRLAAGHVERIMRGTPAGEIPVEQATKIELIINLKAAQALGLQVPQGLMLRADEVIQ